MAVALIILIVLLIRCYTSYSIWKHEIKVGTILTITHTYTDIYGKCTATCDVTVIDICGNDVVFKYANNSIETRSFMFLWLHNVEIKE